MFLFIVVLGGLERVGVHAVFPFIDGEFMEAPEELQI